jgi:hypothetical protein
MITIVSDPLVGWGVSHSLFLLLYVGPDTALPILSFLAAIVGFLLMSWRRLVTLVRGIFKTSSKKPEPSTGENAQPPSTSDSLSK